MLKRILNHTIPVNQSSVLENDCRLSSSEDTEDLMSCHESLQSVIVFLYKHQTGARGTKYRLGGQIQFLLEDRRRCAVENVPSCTSK